MSELIDLIKGIKTGVDDRLAKTDAHLLDLEQRLAADIPGRNSGSTKSWGEQVVASDDLKNFVKNGSRGALRFEVEQKTLTTVPTSGTGWIQPDLQRTPIMLPRRRLVVRSLLAPGRTGSGVVKIVRQATRTNAAATVAETTLKPQSDMGFAVVDSMVRTIAHFAKASRQALDDVSQLESIIDGELRFGLAYQEEVQLLTGDGTGENLSGLIPQATAYDTTRNVTGEQRLDVLSHAIDQVLDQTFLAADGIVINNSDWSKIRLTKTTTGEYVLGDPSQATEPVLWDVPVIVTPAIPAGNFLVGAFYASAQIFDRLDAEVMLSTEDQDNFVRNVISLRAEERLALAVKRPNAFVYGSFGTIPVP